MTGGLQPNDIAVAGFDLDGVLDVAVGNDGSPWVSIFIGHFNGFSTG